MGIGRRDMTIKELLLRIEQIKVLEDQKKLISINREDYLYPDQEIENINMLISIYENVDVSE